MFIDGNPKCPAKWSSEMEITDGSLHGATLITALNELSYTNAMLIAD
jgi:hypothetical protein